MSKNSSLKNIFTAVSILIAVAAIIYLRLYISSNNARTNEYLRVRINVERALKIDETNKELFRHVSLLAVTGTNDSTEHIRKTDKNLTGYIEELVKSTRNPKRKEKIKEIQKIYNVYSADLASLIELHEKAEKLISELNIGNEKKQILMMVLSNSQPEESLSQQKIKKISDIYSQCRNIMTSKMQLNFEKIQEILDVLKQENSTRLNVLEKQLTDEIP